MSVFYTYSIKPAKRLLFVKTLLNKDKFSQQVNSEVWAATLNQRFGKYTTLSEIKKRPVKVAKNDVRFEVGLRTHIQGFPS